MALLFAESFDYYTAAQAFDGIWTSGGISAINAGGRNGTNGAHVPNLLYKYLPNASGNVAIYGAALYFTTIGGVAGTQRFISFADGQTTQVEVALTLTGTIRVTVPSGQYFSSFTLSTNTWYYVDVRAVISNTVGEFQVRVNGTPVLTQTGLDTQVTTNSSWDGFFISALGLDPMDDLYILDGTGSINNAPLGDITVEAKLPQTDAVATGFNHGLTPSTGTDHGALVDEATPNDDTDYNSSASAGAKDTYRSPNISSAGGIRGVIVSLRAKKTDFTTKTARPVVRTAGTDYDGNVLGVPPSYSFLSQVFETNPNTGVLWTGSQVNALEVGLKTVV